MAPAVELLALLEKECAPELLLDNFKLLVFNEVERVEHLLAVAELVIQCLFELVFGPIAELAFKLGRTEAVKVFDILDELRAFGAPLRV